MKISAIPLDILIKIVNNSTNMAELLRNLGYKSSSGPLNTSVRNYLDSININYSHVKFTHNSSTISSVRSNILTSEILVINSSFGRDCAKRRILKEKLLEYKCETCNNVGVWNNKPMTLILDHINGVNNDHRLDNLRFLCPNCNSQTDTFGSRNFVVKKKCINCKIDIKRTSKMGYCKNCLNDIISRQTATKNKPTKEDLEILVWEIPTTTLAKMFGVSDKAISKWCARYKINKPPQGYWTKWAISSVEEHLDYTQEVIGS